MVKLVLLKKPKENVSRDDLIRYLTETHGPQNSNLPGIQYRLGVQVDPTEHDILENREYYDSNETIPVEPEQTQYDTIEIHEFESIEELIKAHNTPKAEEGNMQDYIDYEEEIAFVVEDVAID